MNKVLRRIGQTELPAFAQPAAKRVVPSSQRALSGFLESRNPLIDVPLSVGSGTLQAGTMGLTPPLRPAKTQAGKTASKAAENYTKLMMMANTVADAPRYFKLPARTPPVDKFSKVPRNVFAGQKILRSGDVINQVTGRAVRPGLNIFR